MYGGGGAVQNLHSLKNVRVFRKSYLKMYKITEKVPLNVDIFQARLFIVQESALILKELKEALWIGRSTRWQEETKNHNIKNTKKQIRILKKI